MDTWLSETRAPTLYVKELENEIHLTQGIYDVQSNRVNSTKWKIPLTFTTETECNFVNTTPKYWMTDSMMTLPEVNSSGWIIFNVQQSGEECRPHVERIVRSALSANSFSHSLSFAVRNSTRKE